MPFVPKDWQDLPSLLTPVSAAALEDMETRLAAYTDSLAKVKTYPAFSVAAQGTRTNVAYGALSNGPDEVANVVVGADSLLEAWYDAVWQETTGGAARATLVIGANQLKVPRGAAAAPITQAVGMAGAGGGSTNMDTALRTYSGGLVSGKPAGANFADVNTGEAFGVQNPAATNEMGTFELAGANLTVPSIVAFYGGPCVIHGLPAGTYTIGVQFKASGGATVKASNRKLRIRVTDFT